MKIRFRPATDSNLTLFAHWGEAIVFWLSLFALIFLGIVSTIRYLYFKEVKTELANFTSASKSKIEEVTTPQNQNAAIIDSLKWQIRMNNDKIIEMQSLIDSLWEESNQQIIRPSTSSPYQKIPDNRPEETLQKFQIK